MNMSNEQEANKVEKMSEESDESKTDNGTQDGEFKLTVRKLELPVRPRGVLAE